MIATVILIAIVAQSEPAPPPAPAPVSAPADRDLFAFAEKLFSQQDWYRAIGTYKEYIFFNPDGAHVAEARYRIARCYRFGEKWNHALVAFQEVHPESPLAPAARVDSGYTQLAIHAPEMTRDTLTPMLRPDAPEPHARRAKFLVAMSYVQEHDWKDAATAFEEAAAGAPADDEIATKSKLLAAKVREGDDLSFKSPLLAGLLSIVPGLGHVYVGRFGDAFEAFFFTGLFGFLTAYGWKAGLGRLYYITGGTLTGIFYFANIYGAVNIARQSNRLTLGGFEAELVEAAELKRLYDDTPPPPPGVTLLRLSF